MSPSIKPTGIINFFDKKVLSAKPMEKMYKYAEKNPAGFAAKMALTSALTKDAVACYYYVTQSMHNERIPEEKRKFVASIDLMNGILNVLLQFTIGSWVDKKAPKWFDSLVTDRLKVDDTHKIADEIQPKILAKYGDEAKGLAGEEGFQKIAKFYRETGLGPNGTAVKALKTGFSAAAVLIATQIITKRVFVPYLATPLASWYKKRFLDKVKPEAQPNRVYYEWANIPGNKKMDQTAFSKIAMK